MSIPKRRTLGRDVEDLWARERAQGRPRDRGLSSWDAGAGADEVRDGSGNPVAKIGEHGSVRGLLVPNGAGGWRTVQADAQAKADAALATARTEIAGVRSDLSALTTRVSTAESRLSSVSSSISSLTSRVSTAESRLSSVSSSISSLTSRVSTLEHDLEALAGVVLTIRNGTNALIANFHSRITALETKGGGSGGTRPPNV